VVLPTPLRPNSETTLFLGIVILTMILMYQFPGIALWLPDYLFGVYVP